MSEPTKSGDKPITKAPTVESDEREPRPASEATSDPSATPERTEPRSDDKSFFLTDEPVQEDPATKA